MLVINFNNFLINGLGFNFLIEIIWYLVYHHHRFFHFSMRKIDDRTLRMFLKMMSGSHTMVTHFVKVSRPGTASLRHNCEPSSTQINYLAPSSFILKEISRFNNEYQGLCLYSILYTHVLSMWDGISHSPPLWPSVSARAQQNWSKPKINW